MLSLVAITETLEELARRESTMILLSGTGGRRLFAFLGHFILPVFGKTYLIHWQAGTLLTVFPTMTHLVL